MSKKIIVSLLLVCALSMPVFTKAVTIDELKAQIAALQIQIAQLIAQLAQIQGNTGTAWCHTFNVNMGIGSSGSEVVALQTALSKDGSKTWEYKGYDGVFDEMTASAVTAFQEKYYSEILAPYGLRNGTGYVGKSTRAKLNQVYGCSAICSADAKQCPDGSYVSRTGPNCEFAQCPVQATTTPAICTDSDGGKNYYTKGTATSNGKSYVDYCNSIDAVNEYYCSGDAVVFEISGCPGASQCVDGFCNQRKITSCVDSDNGVNFDIKGYIEVQYSDGTSKRLDDDCGFASGGSGYGAREYSCWLDNTGELNYSSQIKPCSYCLDGFCSTAPVQKSISVVSPISGQIYKTGDVLNIKWNSSNIPSTETVQINLLYKHNDPTYPAGQYFTDWIIQKTANTGSYAWEIPEYYAKGVSVSSFSIQVVAAGGISGYSSGKFSIIPGIEKNEISVTAPLAGGQYYKGGTAPITWLPSINEPYGVSLLRKNDSSFLRMLLSTTGYFSNLSWKIPTDIPDANDYLIRIDQGQGDGRGKTGYSGAFSILSTTTPVTCTDTDQGKTDYYAKGTTTWGPISGQTYTATDGCDLAGVTLSEFYCSGGYSTVNYYTCPNGCSNGACLPAPVQTCAQEGAIVSKITGCCSGLRALATTTESYCPTVYGGNQTFVCTKCGDKICGIGENFCNCREDCTGNRSITVLSPNGGEQFSVGQSYTINWKSTGLSSTSKIKLQYCFGNMCMPVDGAAGLPISSTSYVWNIPSNFFNQAIFSFVTPTDKFKILVSEVMPGGAEGTTGAFDYSDNDFTISKTAPPVTCTDTDQGKTDYYTKGTTTWGPISGQTYTATDSCDLAGVILSEFYCSGGYSTSNYYTCPNGCFDGACKADSKLPVITYVNPSSGNTLNNGTVELYRFRVTNPGTNAISIFSFNLVIDLSDNDPISHNLQLSQIGLYKAGQTAPINKVISEAGTSASALIKIEMTAYSGNMASPIDTVGPGETVEYSLKATVSGATIGDTISTRLMDSSVTSYNAIFWADNSNGVRQDSRGVVIPTSAKMLSLAQGSIDFLQQSFLANISSQIDAIASRISELLK